MARSSASRGGGSRGSSRRGAARAGGAKAGGAKTGGAKAGGTGKTGRAQADAARKPASAAAATPAIAAAGPFRLGVIRGATPGKWVDAWNARMPHTPLDLVPVEVAGQRRALIDGEVDAALVRLPIDREGLHVIALYDEVPVVVASADSHLTAADELELADLAGEVHIVPRDDVLALTVPGTVAPRFDQPETTPDAIATVAAGVGIVVVPMSLARLHHRKDAEYRPLAGAPTSTVALAWVAERTTPAIETFVGIVRGRTANSSR